MISKGELRVLLYSDDQLFRYGIMCFCRDKLPGITLNMTKDEQALLEMISAKPSPDILLLELVVGGRLTLDLIDRIRKQFANLKILVASKHSAFACTERCLRAGANGYLNPQSQLAELGKAFDVVQSGEVFCSQEIQNRLLSGSSEGSRTAYAIDKLTRRELDVFQLLGEGKTTREIARELDLSVKTIESYREKVKEKLRIRTSHDLVRFSLEFTLFDFRTANNK